MQTWVPPYETALTSPLRMSIFLVSLVTKESGAMGSAIPSVGGAFPSLMDNAKASCQKKVKLAVPVV